MKLKGGFAKAGYELRLSSGEVKTGTLNRKGKATIRFRDVALEDGDVTAIWDCIGETARQFSCC